MKVAGGSREARWGIPSDAELWVWESPLESGWNHCLQMFAGVPLFFLFTSWEVSAFNCAGLIFHVCEPGGPWRCLARTWACSAASPSPRVWWSACVSLELCSGGLHWSLSSSQRTTSALCASTQQTATEPRSWVSFSTSHLPPRVAARCPTSLKDSRTGLKLCRDSFFLSVSQTAATKMNSSPWCSPPPPLWTTLWLYSVGSSSTTLVPWWPASVQCECSIYTDRTYRGARVWWMCLLKQPQRNNA